MIGFVYKCREFCFASNWCPSPYFGLSNEVNQGHLQWGMRLWEVGVGRGLDIGFAFDSQYYLQRKTHFE